MYEKLYDLPVTGEPLPFQLPAWIAAAPFEEYLGMRIEEAKDGRARLTMPFQVKHCQGKGLMHGGAVTSLADTSVAMAIKSILPEGTHFVTTDLSLTFRGAVIAGGVEAVATTERVDDRTIIGRAVVRQGERTIAEFTARFRILRRGGNVSGAASASAQSG